MFLSISDIFKVGIGSSSSHTMGPMNAVARFLSTLRDGEDKEPGSGELASLSASLHGSLAFTGKGHASDKAIMLGFMGFKPDTLDSEDLEFLVRSLRTTKQVSLEGLGNLKFDLDKDIVFDYDRKLDGHPNGLILSSFDCSGSLYFREIYYSIGGGFVLTELELIQLKQSGLNVPDGKEKICDFPYAFSSAEEMLKMGKLSGKSIAEMKELNELKQATPVELRKKVDKIREVMFDCINRGLAAEGELPGGLNVKRRAKGIFTKLTHEGKNNINHPHIINDWMSVYAMAVNEENASGKQVVTAPTNGAAGVIPAVLRYYRDHCVGSTETGERTFLLTAAAIGGIIKHRASISGAEVGCQGEVGSACFDGSGWPMCCARWN